jgi:hypothetical protein
MNKEFEALDDFMDLVTCQDCFEKAQKCYDIIEEALNELKAIKESNLSEALEYVENIQSEIEWAFEFNGRKIDEYEPEYFDTIKQALLKAQENERVIHAIEQYIDMRLAIEPLDDVAKAFKEIKQQLQIIKECK